VTVGLYVTGTHVASLEHSRVLDGEDAVGGTVPAVARPVWTPAVARPVWTPGDLRLWGADHSEHP